MTMPWQPKDRPQQGRDSEAKTAKDLGMRLHPMSGAGGIKFDMSDDEYLVEHKDWSKSGTVTLTLIKSLWKEAMKLGKTPVLLIKFPGFNIYCTVERTTDA